LISEQTK
jgi:hypothetical protein